MATLFSPIGTADPITQLGDGPMLHIVRNKRLEKVVLYLSPKMSGYEHRDNRYTKAIELLSEHINMQMPEIELIESHIKEVYRFDYYIEEFESILEKLASTEEELLVNVSSGTAGMAQALVAIGSFGRFDLELLQVTTPKKDINSRHDREDPDNYNLNEMWEWDCEIEAKNENRIVAVKTPNFAERLLRENVSILCRSYEFESASKLVQEMKTVSVEAKEMIEATSARLNLDGNRSAGVFGGTDLCYKPDDLLLEYLYVMEVRLEQSHWADFMRSLSPALTELMKRKLRPFLPDDKYILPKEKDTKGRMKNRRTSDKYNVESIQSDEKLESILRRHHYETSFFISNDAFMDLIESYCENEEETEQLKRLRNAEKRGRNSLAHSLRVSSREALEKECGISFDEIMDLLFELHGSAKPGLYRRIVEEIDTLL